MANRSYLYAAHTAPDGATSKRVSNLRGLSEWNWDIPLVHKILLSGQPRACRSSIWNSFDSDIALIGDYAQGIKRLRAFTARIRHPSAAPLIEETFQFLNHPDNFRSCLVLECGEIFELNDDDLVEQNVALIEEINHLEPVIEEALKQLHEVVAPADRGFLSKLFGSRATTTTAHLATEDFLQQFNKLGFGNWGGPLYFDFSHDDDDDVLSPDSADATSPPIDGFGVIARLTVERLGAHAPRDAEEFANALCDELLENQALDAVQTSSVGVGEIYAGAPDFFGFDFGPSAPEDDTFTTAHTVVVRKTADGGFMLLLSDGAEPYAPPLQVLFEALAQRSQTDALP